MKELMQEYMEEEDQFKEVIEKILREHGYSFITGFNRENDDPEYHVPYDYKMSHQLGETIIDVKIYRSNTVDPTMMGNAVSHLQQLAQLENVRRIMVVTNIDVPFVDRVGAINDVLYEVVGPSQLYAMTSDHEIKAELYEALEPLTNVIWEPQPVPATPISTPPAITPTRGGFDPDLAVRQLKECPDRDGAAFERACIYAIKGVFANDFNRWTDSQHRIEEGHHRLDLMGHMNPRNDFWKGLRHDFRSRYIVFEFKNYLQPISQKEIYSTEKYLFAGALRMVAIMVARNGEDAGSRKARIGALREHGKLIMLLTSDELIKVVEAFKIGDDAYGVLIDNLHEMLSGIGR